MAQRILALVAALGIASSALAQANKTHEFEENRSGTPGRSEGERPSQIEATRTEAALKFTIVNKDKGAIPGVVVKLTGPDGKPFYTEESDSTGYAEVLVPVGQTYEVVYLSLGRQEIAAKIPVDAKPKQTIKLTLRYKRLDGEGPAVRFVLKGVEFDTGKATIRDGSFERLDSVVEYMTHKKSARIEISGHTDNVGKAKANKQLSKKRAEAVRAYVVSKGVDKKRVTAVGYGDERPVAPNDSEEGRQRNRRIEAREL